MQDNHIEKLIWKAGDNYSKFKSVSDYIGKHYIGALPVQSLNAKERDVISTFSAMDMCIGSEFTKKKFIAAGILIGVGGTIALEIIITKIRKKIEA